MNNHKQANLNSVKSSSPSMGKSLKLKTKATLLAIAIGTIPVLVTGATGYYFANKLITQDAILLEEERARELQDKIGRFMQERLGDIKVLTGLKVFVDPENFTVKDKTEILQRVYKAYGVYDSIAVFDLKGNVIAQTDKGAKLENHLDRPYVQAALKANRAILSQPIASKSTDTYSIYAVSPIHDETTGKPIGFARNRLPVKVLAEIAKSYQTDGQQYYLVNDAGEVFLGAEEFASKNGQQKLQIKDIFADLALTTDKKESSNQTITNQLTNTRQLVSVTAPTQLEGIQELGWKAIISEDVDFAFAAQRQLALTFGVGIGITALLVAAIASYLANRATMPIIDAVTAVKKIGSGELDTRLAVNSKDELGELNTNINLMTEQIQKSLQEQKTVAEQIRQEKEQLELAIYALIEEVSDATEGDLTVRANLDSLELSTVADLFNAIIGNLQDIAIEAKESSEQVGDSLKQNEEAIRLLAEQALLEAKETRDTLKSVALMSQSIQEVAANASQAEKITDDTYNTIVDSTGNMDLTVNSILELRTTVGETAKKMKRLGESSQKISQVVSFIEEIALKTNVLAINASVEAGRAGEYGQGFTIVAEQVGALAEQSAAAIKEIASIVAAIQTETQEVNQAMESGTTQVVQTTRLVETTKQSLNLVLEKSQEINQLMSSISQSAISQADVSQNIISLMQKIAHLSSNTSKSSTEVAQSILATAKVAAQLESTVGQFKVAK
ncbi:methyl-accepting chemotaxis protein [Pleurocapsa sp. CCALA 161]|uniref:methyl-accepting chemotaxis protein n=1 Tax=Pleurocapsa sp. CCALA 161 TaxID=2107688 RepID=UPI001E33A8E1|nr:methyl-accepting chemotaxis protein [Pleurocapsa sp. CCALA 161]